MRLATFVDPKSSPKIQATRSNFATATSPQLSPPTMSSVAAMASSFLIGASSVSLCGVGTVASAYKDCQDAVQIMYSYGHRRIPPHRRAQQALRGEPGAAASVGAPLRRPPARALAGRPAPLHRRRPRAGTGDAAAHGGGDGRGAGRLARGTVGSQGAGALDGTGPAAARRDARRPPRPPSP